jgi:transposase
LIFVGHDWAEDHHDVVVLDEVGERLASARLVEGVDGVARFHGLVAESVDEAEEVVIGTETNRGLFVGALVAAGYQVFAVNPKAVDRYRDRHRVAGGKSDAADAKVLADLVRTDRHLHRPVAADSELAEALTVLTRAHKDLIWQRQGQVNQLRSALREYYPGALEAFGTELAHPDALAVLALAPTPEHGQRLSPARIASALRRAGRQRNVEVRARTIRAPWRRCSCARRRR